MKRQLFVSPGKRTVGMCTNMSKLMISFGTNSYHHFGPVPSNLRDQGSGQTQMQTQIARIYPPAWTGTISNIPTICARLSSSRPQTQILILKNIRVRLWPSAPERCFSLSFSLSIVIFKKVVPVPDLCNGVKFCFQHLVNLKSSVLSMNATLGVPLGCIVYENTGIGGEGMQCDIQCVWCSRMFRSIIVRQPHHNP